MTPYSSNEIGISEPTLGRPDLSRGPVVSRTHRVVRERARLMEERRSRARSLMLPLLLCSVLLALTAFAVWTGLYQYQTVEAVAADMSALADTNNHLMVVVLWFVPVSLAVFSALWMRRSRGNQGDDL
jgi:H+/Cl- antiporter ClcA